MTWTPERLIAFEDRVRDAFLAKRIHAPIHLSGGDESQMIDVFKKIRPNDWKLAGWRSHYVALLSGIPEEEVFRQILEGRSMYLSSSEHRLICSSIVGGILPVACGLALGARLSARDDRVHVFLGDMGARTGLFFEFMQYCEGHRLPVHVVISDNGFSTNTPTDACWGEPMEFRTQHVPVTRYKYARKWPHVGVGSHVNF